MNKNLKRKLIISGFAMTFATFATTATTYAWFTSNTTVSTNTITGTVAEDDSIYVGANGGNLGGSVELDASGVKFKPAQVIEKNGIITFNDLDETTLESGVDYFEFSLKFGGQNGTIIYLSKAEFKNNVSEIPSFTLKADAGSDDSVKKGKSVQVDVVDSLALSITSNNATMLYKYRENPTTSYDSAVYYENIIGSIPEKASDVLEFEESYLADIKSEDLNTLIRVGEINNGTLEVTFRIFLDGWDKDCFDAIANQTFSSTLEFSSGSSSQNN